MKIYKSLIDYMLSRNFDKEDYEIKPYYDDYIVEFNEDILYEVLVEEQLNEELKLHGLELSHQVENVYTIISLNQKENESKMKYVYDEEYEQILNNLTLQLEKLEIKHEIEVNVFKTYVEIHLEDHQDKAIYYADKTVKEFKKDITRVLADIIGFRI